MSEFRHVRVTSDGMRGAVEVDGVDLSGAVTNLHLSAGVDEFTELDLDLVLAVHQTEFEGQARVQVLMTDETRDALIHLGWTPPRGTQ